ncbi:Abhydrolase domain-containing protein 4 [Orchesella cincta]|uniref:Abhydrolase domain-containing protein 4 n=1 Tax=Orchesella cincta TaxID=48709 RepID=A0A1D2NAW1_ORCCI|nr:Abhydrolase domain-containing protein 4 [Orchesella cincta]
MPGFGQSTRPVFSSDPSIAEEQFLIYMEAWREKVGLPKMIMLGHSMGAFLGVFICAQGCSHDIRRSMGMITTIGFSEKPVDLSQLTHIPTTHRMIVKVLDSLPLNPLWTVRLMGPMGAELIKRVRMDLISNFVHVLDDAPSKVANYIFHCNVQKPATGETAYHAMMSTFGWAKNPLVHRLSQLDPEIPMTLMYGSRSWVDHYPGEKIQATRPSSYVSYHVVVSGHHIYADTVKSFNEITLAACEVEQKDQDVVKLF